MIDRKLPRAPKCFSEMDYKKMAEGVNDRAINRPSYHMEYIKKYGNGIAKEKHEDIRTEEGKRNLPKHK